MPVRNDDNRRRGAIHKFIDRIEENNIISAIKFNEGGAAILAEHKTNHIKVVIGNKDIKPLVKKMFRVWVASYCILAKEKRADEHSPWAIIITRELSHPQTEVVIIPAVNKAICPIDE